MGKSTGIVALAALAVMAATEIGIRGQGAPAGVASTVVKTYGLQPPKELIDVMKANQVVLGVDGRGGNIVGRLGENIKNDDFDAIQKDAQDLRPNFEKIATIFTQLKMDDAVAQAKVGLKAVADLENSAKAKDKRGVTQAQINLATACRTCHLSRRVHILTVPLRYEIAERELAKPKETP